MQRRSHWRRQMDFFPFALFRRNLYIHVGTNEKKSWVFATNKENGQLHSIEELTYRSTQRMQMHPPRITSQTDFSNSASHVQLYSECAHVERNYGVAHLIVWCN